MSLDESRFQDIESKIAFQEHLLENLNEALTSQQKQLDGLSRQLKKITQILETSEEQISRPEEEVPPPHY